MNDLKDVQRIIEEYIVITNEVRKDVQTKKVWKDAEKRSRELLAELKSLKLPLDDRSGFLISREALEMGVRAFREGAKGRFDKTLKFIKKADALLTRYLKEVG